MRRSILLLFLLAGCATTPVVQGPPARPRLAPDPPGLVQINGKREAEVLALLGAASMARSEGPARQLQFIRPPCVLDVFLYPKDGQTRVSTAFARRPDGAAMPPGDCLKLIIPQKP